MTRFLALVLLVVLVFSQSLSYTTSFPLSRQGRWIVDDKTGKRTKLACANWPSHLEPMVAEGLSKQPLDSISKSVTSMGFNCVRFTWPVYLATDDSLASFTVGQSFENLGLADSLAGIQTKNPEILNLTLIEAYKAVVSNLANNNIMVVLDNHISKPGWCCNDDDGNGFFGDEYFNPEDWIKGLTRMATIFSGFTNVVGMSLRNELRGQRANVDDWFRYMQMGAEAVRSANPNVLVIVSGLNYDTDLSHLADRNLDTKTLDSKLVFEMHWYSFTDSKKWRKGDPSSVCDEITSDVMSRAAFLVDRGWPLFVSEWGGDPLNTDDNGYLDCIFPFLAAQDLDWAIWCLQGSYYIREGQPDYDESYGLLNSDWSSPRNPDFLKRIAAIQPRLQGSSDADTESVGLAGMN